MAGVKNISSRFRLQGASWQVARNMNRNVERENIRTEVRRAMDEYLSEQNTNSVRPGETNCINPRRESGPSGKMVGSIICNII